MPDTFYIRVRGRIYGPYDTKQLLELRNQGRLLSFHDISSDQKEWYSAGNIVDLFPPKAQDQPKQVRKETTRFRENQPEDSDHDTPPPIPRRRNYREYRNEQPKHLWLGIVGFSCGGGAVLFGLIYLLILLIISKDPSPVFAAIPFLPIIYALIVLSLLAAITGVTFSIIGMFKTESTLSTIGALVCVVVIGMWMANFLRMTDPGKREKLEQRPRNSTLSNW